MIAAPSERGGLPSSMREPEAAYRVAPFPEQASLALQTAPAEALERIKSAIQASGVSLSEAFRREKTFPPIIAGNIQAGEATGSLPEVLGNLTEYYIEDLDDAVTRFTAIIEPVMIIFLAAIIGTMVIAMYQPLFNLAQVLNKTR